MGKESRWDSTWDIDSYDPGEFYVRSTDRKGHGDVLYVRVPPEIHRRLEEVVQSGRFPAYRTMQDLVRDAIVHHLHRRLKEADLPIPSDFQLLLEAERWEKWRRVSATAEQLAERVAETLQDLAQMGRHEDAKSAAIEALGAVANVSDPAARSRAYQALRQAAGKVFRQLGVEIPEG